MKHMLIILALGLFVAGCSSESEDQGLTEVDAPEQNEAEANVENEESTEEEVTEEANREENERRIVSEPVDVPTVKEVVPEKIETLIQYPEDTEFDKSKDENGDHTVEQQLMWLWEKSNLLPETERREGIAETAVKESAKYASYQDYVALSEMGIAALNRRSGVDLGSIHSLLKNRHTLVKSNEIADLGDIQIIGALTGVEFTSLTFEVRNTSGKPIDMVEIQENIQFRFTENYGMGTDWFDPYKYEYLPIEEYRDPSSHVDRFIGSELIKRLEVRPQESPDIDINSLAEGFDSMGLLDRLEGMSVVLGRFAIESQMDQDEYELLTEYQEQIPEEIKMEIKYKGDVAPYSLVKNETDMEYDDTEMKEEKMMEYQERRDSR